MMKRTYLVICGLCIGLASFAQRNSFNFETVPNNQVYPTEGEKGHGKYFERCSALAFQGNATAQYYLGTCYEYGLLWNLKVDKDQALDWYQKAADGGNVLAQYRLAKIYESGYTSMGMFGQFKKNRYGQNYGMAFELYRSVAARSYSQVVAEIGSYFDFYKKNLGKLLYTRKGYINDNIRDYKIAQYKTAWMYECGLGTRPNNAEAVKFCNLAVYDTATEPVKSNDWLGQWYKDALSSVKKNKVQKYYPETVSLICFHVGHIYEKGYGVTPNSEKATEWFWKSADKWHENEAACVRLYNLGKQYYYTVTSSTESYDYYTEMKQTDYNTTYWYWHNDIRQFRQYK